MQNLLLNAKDPKICYIVTPASTSSQTGNHFLDASADGAADRDSRGSVRVLERKRRRGGNLRGMTGTRWK